MFPCLTCLPSLIGRVPITLLLFAQSWRMPARRVDHRLHLASVRWTNALPIMGWPGAVFMSGHSSSFR